MSSSLFSQSPHWSRLARGAFFIASIMLGFGAVSARAQTAVVQIDTGSSSAVSPFVADEDFSSGGNEFSSGATINTSGAANPAPMAVYQTVRWASSFTYTIPGLTSGTSYTVRLHFAELSFTASGQRVFNVAINGTNVLSNFDIFAHVGENAALIEQFTATANSSGQIVIAFTQGTADNPEIAGIQVLTVGAPSAPTGLSATPNNESVSLSWTASSGATSYKVYRSTTSGGEGTTAYATVTSGTSYTDTGVTNGTAYYYTVAAVNSAGTSAQSAQVTATPTAGGGGSVKVQIDTGSSSGVSPFVADEDFSSGGNEFSSTATISTSGVASPAPMAVYQTVRWASSFTYTIPGLTSGTTYEVRLHFAELSFTAAGQREFNVAINGTSVLSNFDIFAHAGENAALIEQFNATANSSGQIVVAFTQGAADNPEIAGLEVLTEGAPPTPTGVTAAAGNGTVTINWSSSAGATSYNIYRSTTSGGEGTTVWANVSSGLSYTDSAVTNGTAYYYTVAAVNSAGTSAQSSQVTATPEPSLPAVPTGVTAAGASGSVTVSWSAVSGATSYKIYRSTTSGGEGSTAYATVTSGTSYTDTAVTNGTPYYYTVAAVNASGTSAQSSQVSATPSGGGGGTPNTPLVQIDSGSSSAVSPFAADEDFSSGGNEFASSATISTTGVTNAAPMAVYQTVRWASSFTYTIPGLTSGTSYVVRLHFAELSFTGAGDREFNVAINGTSVLTNFDIFAHVGENAALVEQFNATANSSGQIVVAFTAGAKDNPELAGLEIWTQPPLPGAPSGLTATAGTSQVSLTWTAGSNATSYNVYRGTSAGGESTTPIATGVSGTNLVDSGVTNGTTYYYKVTSVNSAGSSGYSNEASALPHVVPPSTPANFVASAGFGNVSLTWAASQGATSYNIYRSTTSGGEGSTAYATGVTGTSFTDSSVTAGTTYYYEIVAVDSAGNSVISAQVSATPQSATGQGAVFPYIRYRAATATYGGGATLVTDPNFNEQNLAAQASEQAYVQLPSSGSYVSFTVNQSNVNGVTMRFTLPDSSTGFGQNSSVSCYVNGTLVQTINLTSYYAWQYFAAGGDPSDTPESGSTVSPAFAFDEVHWMLPSSVSAGAVIKIQSTGGPTVGVDFLELETVPAALTQPAGSISVASYGAVAYGNNNAAYSEIAGFESAGGYGSTTTAPGVTDSTAAFNAAIAAALATPGSTLYIPAGTYYISAKLAIGTATNGASNLTVTGAGIWYTNIQFTNPNVSGGGFSIMCSPTGSMNFSNMYLNSMLRSRYDENAIYKCFEDDFGQNSNFHDLWEEHFECGYWVADYAHNPCQIASGLTIKNNRIRNNLADGVNFCNGTYNSTVTNCNIRNGGDDGLAVWPNNFNGAPMAYGDTFSYNTIEFEWRSSAMAIYGGSGHQLNNNLVEDLYMSAGFRVTTGFSGYQFQNNTGITLSNDTFIDCGTYFDAWGGELGAIDLEASNSAVQNFTFTNIQVVDALHDGYSFGFSGGIGPGIVFNSCVADGPGLDGLTASKYTQAHLGAGIESYTGNGSVTFNNFSYSNCAGGEDFLASGFVLNF
jgi:fibronectin type 3 domain-containing protein